MSSVNPQIDSSCSRTRTFTLMRMLLAACGLAVLVGLVAGYCHARRRIAALEYIQQSSSGRGVSFASVEWWPASLPLPEWMQAVDQVVLSMRPCVLRRLTALAELNGLSCSGCEIDHE